MRPSDFLLLMGVCLIWALNVVIGTLILTRFGVPPFYYAAIRFLGVAVLLLPFLSPLPRKPGRVVLVALLVGAGHFGLLFLGLTTATPSSTAIVLQLGIPLTTVLSVVFLGERVSFLRVAGIATAFTGVIIVLWSPGALHASSGLLAVVGSTAALAVGSILLKRLEPISPLRLQAWVGLISWAPLMASSTLLEHGQIEASAAGGWVLVAAVAFSVVVVTIAAHTIYFGLLQRYPASTVAPLTLAMPVMTILLGILLNGDKLEERTIAGAALALLGVLVTLKARNPAPLPARVP